MPYRDNGLLVLIKLMELLLFVDGEEIDEDLHKGCDLTVELFAVCHLLPSVSVVVSIQKYMIIPYLYLLLVVSLWVSFSK